MHDAPKDRRSEFEPRSLEATDETSPLLVVGIGASAGGLDAYKKLLRSLPGDTGSCFVLVQHLDPSHESMMVDLLSKHTSMAVREARNNMSLSANTIYMIPPDAFLRVEDGNLCVEPPTERRGMRMAIDHFFRSLAEDRGERAIGIVLSGTGSDGTAGLRAIKARGGLTIAQEPRSANHDGMPRSAISAGAVDLVLSVEDMPEALTRYVAHPYLHEPEPIEVEREHDGDELQQIFGLLKARLDFDANHYKSSTVLRRIRRRMGFRYVEDLEDYLKLLREEPEELERLCRDLLISVTDFFRDPEAFELIRNEVAPEIIRSAARNQSIRLWIPGCATGEEAYSLAICFVEALRECDGDNPLQVFATDVDVEALKTARTAIYPLSSLGTVSRERLERFFEKADNELFRVRKALRDCVSFAEHDVLRDAPFSRLDLLSCRNLLIYLRKQVQKDVFELFHFALRPGGVLFLGSSEAPSMGRHAFEPLSKKWRIYRRTGPSRRGHVRFPLNSRDEGRAEIERPPPRKRDESRDRELGDVAREVILEANPSAAVVVDQDHHVLFLHGPVQRYLDLPEGEMRPDLLSMLKDNLRRRVRAGLYKATRDDQDVVLTGQVGPLDGERAPVTIRIHPSRNRGNAGLIAVVFEPLQEGPEKQDKPSEATPVADSETIIRQLEHELESTREDLRNTIEELETSNEELKSSNEETMSMNEELQSTNEELEASAEELRSLNEELSTVNQQLRDKIAEVEEAHNDLANLLSSSRIITVFLDVDLCVRRFTPAAEKAWGLRSGDVGRPLVDLIRNIDPSLEADARSVLEDLSPRACQIHSGDRWFERRILPYRTEDDRILGVVITLSDVTGLKATTDELAARVRQQAAVAELGMLALTEDSGALGKLLERVPHVLADAIGVEFAKVLQLEPDGNLLLRSGCGWKEGLVGRTRIPTGQDSQGGYTLRTNKPVIVDDLRNESRFRAPKLLVDHGIVSGMSCIVPTAHGPWGALGVHTRGQRSFSRDDINFLQSVANVLGGALQRSDVEEKHREGEMRLRLALGCAGMASWEWDLNSDEAVWDDKLFDLLGASPETTRPSGQAFLERVHPDDIAKVRESLQRAANEGEDFDAAFRIVRPDGSERWLAGMGSLVESQGHQKMFGVNYDVTEDKQAAEARETLDRRKDEFLAILGHELRNPLAALESGIQLLQRDDRSEEELRWIREMMATEVKKTVLLINDLLDLTRIARGKIALRKEPIDAVDVLERVLRATASLFEERSHVLEVDAPKACPLHADPRRLEQILTNLLSNAAKYTPESGRIGVKLDRADRHVVIEVSDTGIGVPGESREEIFEPFVQIRAEGAVRGGLGIGLSLVRQLVKLHGGKVAVESDGADSGSVFRVILPQNLEAITSSRPRPRRQRPIEGSPRVLVVDDNLQAARALGMLLEERGCRVDLAYSGDAALELVRTHRPQFVLLDIGLPDRNGYEVAREIRAIEGLDTIIVAVTGFGHAGARRESDRAGFDHFLLKPVDMRALVEILNAKHSADER